MNKMVKLLKNSWLEITDLKLSNDIAAQFHPMCGVDDKAYAVAGIVPNPAKISYELGHSIN
jgi:hypothetical protein